MLHKRGDFAATYLSGRLVVAGGLGESECFCFCTVSGTLKKRDVIPWQQMENISWTDKMSNDKSSGGNGRRLLYSIDDVQAEEYDLYTCRGEIVVE